MVARYFDLIWPEYERQVVIENGVPTQGQLQLRRRLSSYNVNIFN
jgi:hypothetical protein